MTNPAAPAAAPAVSRGARVNADVTALLRARNIGGLQCRSAAGGGVRKLPDELGGWIASIETSPEMAGFAFGILRGWADSESFARKEQGR